MGSGTAGPLMSQVNQNYGGGHAPSTAGQPGYYNTMAGQYGALGWGQPGMQNMMQPGLSPGFMTETTRTAPVTRPRPR